MTSEGIYNILAGKSEPIDILLPTRGKLDELTRPCVEALYANTRNPFHLIVLDSSTPDMDKGKDETPQYFRRMQIERNNITYIHSGTEGHPEVNWKSGNHFFNVGLAHSKHQYAAAVMNSVRVEPDWDIVPVQMMKDNPRIGIIGMKCLMGHNGLIESAGIKMVGHLPCDMGRDHPSHQLSGSYPCFSVQWAFALLRKEAVVGNLDEDLWQPFVGWDDIDNTVYLRYKGWEAWYCGLGVGYHSPHATRGSDTDKALLMNRMNAEKFYKRWGYWEEFLKANPYTPEFYEQGKVEFLAEANKLPMTFEGSLATLPNPPKVESRTDGSKNLISVS
ncbi:hypothetical protein LCGC14_0637730 [marine sediment metagenome]|uniref:Glycosyltransferase 2-like domain-containing protein n=1 Tax=marine sediment metagenome TaxID=412755 RepID=A0A0F9RJG1_9ZZZZ